MSRSRPARPRRRAPTAADDVRLACAPARDDHARRSTGYDVSASTAAA
jgi:hypothetical protein